MRRVAQDVSLQALFVLKERACDELVDTSGRHERDGFCFVSDVLPVGDALVCTRFLSKTPLKVLHAEAPRASLVIADDHRLQCAFLVRR